MKDLEKKEALAESNVSTQKTSPLNPVHFSSETPEWATPQWLFDALTKEFGFTLDPCSTHQNAKCERHYTREDNGLMRSWAGESVFMNPPYGDEISAWMAKAYGEAEYHGATVVCLIPARTDTRWWHAYAMKHEIRLIQGRLVFGDATDSAPFPSAIVVMRPLRFKLSAFCPETLTSAGLASFNPKSDLILGEKRGVESK